MTMALPRTPIPATVDVFNADYALHSTAPWSRAFLLLLKGKAYAVENHSPAVHIRSAGGEVMELPASVVLAEYAHKPYTPQRCSKIGVLRRDKHTCAYCGAKANTVDHVLPRSRGGADSWINLVAACQTCNGRKGDRTPSEAGMKLRWEPYEPRGKVRFAC